jgi:hypothetical protein
MRNEGSAGDVEQPGDKNYRLLSIFGTAKYFDRFSVYPTN